MSVGLGPTRGREIGVIRDIIITGNEASVVLCHKSYIITAVLCVNIGPFVCCVMLLSILYRESRAAYMCIRLFCIKK